MAILAQFFCGRDEGHIFIADASGGDPLITGFPLGLLFPKLSTTSQAFSKGAKAKPERRCDLWSSRLLSTALKTKWYGLFLTIFYLYPFHALPTKEGFLGFRNPVCYTPSASTLPVCRRGPRLDRKPVIALEIPQDLRYARLEAERVADFQW